MQSKVLNIGAWVLVILLTFLLFKSCSEESKPADVIERVVKTTELKLVRDTIYFEKRVPVIKYVEKTKIDTLKIVKYSFPEIEKGINFKSPFGIKGTNLFCSKEFEAIDTLEGKFGKIITTFHYPSNLFDYDIFTIDSTITERIFISNTKELNWTQKEWFLYTTNAISLIGGVYLGTQATR